MITHITDQINMGSGDYSLAQMGYLYRRLGEAFTILGGIQQHPMCTEPAGSMEKHLQDEEDAEIELENIVKEICLALTGKKVRF